MKRYSLASISTIKTRGSTIFVFFNLDFLLSSAVHALRDLDKIVKISRRRLLGVELKGYGRVDSFLHIHPIH